MQRDTGARPIRVLHVIGTLDRGGIETWLMNIWRRVDRRRFEHSVLVNNGTEGAYGDELRGLNIPVYYAPHPANILQYRKFFLRTLEAHGPYDIVHSHVYDLSGFVLKLAEASGVPVRIAQSHNTRLVRGGINGLVRQVTWPLQQRWIQLHATGLAAVSDAAGKALFGQLASRNARPWSILPLGIDLAPFQSAHRAHISRRELGIPPHAFVIGHVGAFSQQKNHDLLVDIFRHVYERDPNAWLLLVGDGPLGEKVRTKVERLKLTERVTFAGVRDDVPELMVHAMDVFLFPSRFEGLGLVLVEAQAAGLPCVVAHTIPNEAMLVESLIRRVPLSGPLSTWTDSILSMRDSKVDKQGALSTIEGKGHSLDGSLEALETFYLSLVRAEDSRHRTTIR